MLAVVEAKTNDVEAGLGPCVAQLIGARRFNHQAGRPIDPLFGCVTTGEVWQFLRLEDSVATLDAHRCDLDDLTGILGRFRLILEGRPAS